MKSLGLYAVGNIVLATMWIGSLISQADNTFFALSAVVVSAISAGFGIIWAQLWKVQAALLADKDKLIAREIERFEEIEQRYQAECERSQQLQRMLDGHNIDDEASKSNDQ